MSTQLNFDTEQLSSMELYSLRLQKVVADFTDFDTVTKQYVDQKVAQAKQELTAGASSALDTFKELEDYLTASGVAGGLVEQINALSTSIATEQARASGAESTLTANLASEVSRATAAENALQSEVDITQEALGTNATGHYQASQASHYISSATTFKGADDLLDAQVKVNADAIVTERDRAYAEEQDIKADIIARDTLMRSDFASADNAEQIRAVAEEGRIEAKVDAEATRAAGAEATLQANIDALSSGQSSDNAAQTAEAAGIKYATFGTNNTADYGELGYKYVADAGNHFYDGSTGEPVMATHIKNLDESLYYTREAIGSIGSSGRLQFSSPLPKYIASNPNVPLTSMARDVIEGFTNINNHFEAEVNSTSTDRANIRSEFAAEDALIQGDLDAQKAKQAGDKSNADSDRVRIQGELDTQKGKQQSEHDANVVRLNGLDGDVAGLSANIQSEVSRAQGAEGALQGDLTAQVSKQDGEHQENVGRLDGHDGRLNDAESNIQALGDRPHNVSVGGFDVQHIEGSSENKYLFFSKKWRLFGSSDGSRLVFQYNKGDEITENWVNAIPFISHQ